MIANGNNATNDLERDIINREIVVEDDHKFRPTLDYVCVSLYHNVYAFFKYLTAILGGLPGGQTNPQRFLER